MGNLQTLDPLSLDADDMRNFVGLTEKPYLGQCATRCSTNNSTIDSSIATWALSRKMHFTTDRLVDPVLVFSNVAVNASYVETSAGDTVTAFVEYPRGTFTAVSAATSYVNGLARIKFSGLTIPRRKKFWVHALQLGPTTGVCQDGGVIHSCADADDGMIYGTGTAPDMSTYPFAGRAFQGKGFYGPVAILSMTRKRTYAVVGTSLEKGIADFVDDNSGDIGTFGRILGAAGIGYINMGVATSLLAVWLTAPKTMQLQLFDFVSDVINAHAINDFQGGGDTIEQFVGRRVQFAALFASTKRVLGCTMMPQTNTTFTSVSISSITTAAVSAISVTSLTRSGDLVTATVASTVGLKKNQLVRIAGATPAGYNGDAQIVAITGATTFLYRVVDRTLTTPATGTITMLPNRLATATVANTAGMASVVNIVGATGSGFVPINGPKTVTIVNSTTFTFSVPVDIAASVTGTLSYDDKYSVAANLSIGRAQQLGFNDRAREGILGEDALIDLADLIDPLRKGVMMLTRDPYAITSTPALLTADGTHGNNLLNGILRDRGVSLYPLLAPAQ